MNDGYPRWQQLTLGAPPIVGGYQLSGDSVTSLSISDGPAGVAIELLGGGAVYQRPIAHQYAPLSLSPSPLSLEIDAASEEDFHRLARLKSSAAAAPVSIFIELPIEDVWVITGAAKTAWTLSRSMPWPAVSIATHAPRAWISDPPGGAGEQDSLAVVTSGVPIASQILVDDGGDVTQVVTGDISAEAGRHLIVRYHPMRLVSVGSIERDFNDAGELVLSIDLAEVIPKRTYAGLDG